MKISGTVVFIAMGTSVALKPCKPTEQKYISLCMLHKYTYTHKYVFIHPYVSILNSA